jgi:hypothetical protein
MFVSNTDVDRSNKCFFCKVKVSGCLSSNCWLFAGQKVVLAQSWIGIGNDHLINSIQWWTRSSQETATSKCLTLLGGVGKYMFVVVKKRFDCTVVMSSRLNSYQLFRTRIVPGIATLSHLNSYRSEFVQWYSPIVFNLTGFTGSQSWNIDNLIDTE